MPTRKKKHLTIEEKRDWLASVFRDTSGEFSQADKFKAMAEDTRLAQLEEEKTAAPPSPVQETLPLSLLDHLPPARDRHNSPSNKPDGG